MKGNEIFLGVLIGCVNISGLDVGVQKDVDDGVVFTIDSQPEEEPQTLATPIIVRFESQPQQQQPQVQQVRQPQQQPQVQQVRQLQQQLPQRQFVRQIAPAEELPSPIPMRIQVPKSRLEAGQTILMRRPDGTLVQVVLQRQQQQLLQRQVVAQPKPVRPVRSAGLEYQLY